MKGLIAVVCLMSSIVSASAFEASCPIDSEYERVYPSRINGGMRIEYVPCPAKHSTIYGTSMTVSYAEAILTGEFGRSAQIVGITTWSPYIINTYESDQKRVAVRFSDGKISNYLWEVTDNSVEVFRH